MKHPAPNLNALWSTLLIEELVRNGVRHFCVPSGSRSAPLVTAVAAHPEIRAVHHFDERGAAFHVLGYGRATGKPAAVITTSGTAVSLYFAARNFKSILPVALVLWQTCDPGPAGLRTTGAGPLAQHRPAWYRNRPGDERAIQSSRPT